MNIVGVVSKSFIDDYFNSETLTEFVWLLFEQRLKCIFIVYRGERVYYFVYTMAKRLPESILS